jgi:excisionase family DNA binding protein
MSTQTASISPAPPFEPLIDPKRAGQLLGVHAKTILKMARAREVPAVRIGKHWRFRASHLDSYVRDRLQSPGQPA